MTESSRREFLRLMGASLSLATAGCLRRPDETIVPYAQAPEKPEKLVPGRPLYYATSVTLGGYATGVLVETHEGRPTKVEGNPEHPASLGATDLYAQAQVLSLYDPDRSQSVLHQGRPASFDLFLKAMERELERLRATGGKGLRILTETLTSPSLGQQISELLERFPGCRWHQYEPVHRDGFRAGTTLAFGAPVDVRHNFDKAQLIVSLGADFLGRGPAWVREARQFADRRRMAAGALGMNRLVVIESGLSITGSNADHRLTLRPHALLRFAQALAAALLPESRAAAPGRESEPFAAWISWLAKELNGHRGAALILAGDEQPPAVHALTCALNYALGNIGSTVEYTRPVGIAAGLATASLKELTADMAAGAVTTLFILGANPAYYAPVDFDFASQLDRVPLRVHLGLYADETARLCHWHVPESHPFESWSDSCAYDGTAGLCQPLLAPLYGGHSAHELLALLQERSERSGYELLRAYWRSKMPAASFEKAWAQSLQRGVISDTAYPALDLTLRPEGVREALLAPKSQDAGLVLLFQPDPTIWDGRFANNSWLQELPKPLCTLTWENAAQLSPDTARRLDVATGDLVEIRHRGRSLEAPVLVAPGHADETVLLSLGYGRTAAGRVGNGIGSNSYVLRTADEPWIATGATLRKLGPHRPLALTHGHHTMEGREPVRSSTLRDYQKSPRAPHARHEKEETQKAGLTLFPGAAPESGPENKPEGAIKDHAWGMVIDLTTCIGCGACTLACQAENNIPVVGPKEVRAGREMHWIRVDRYYQDGLVSGQPEVVHQPVPCMHCETAPCELVCPVAATVHDHEGLNDMVYNRCVGTRYCSNNCPYKVRRFNFFHYSKPRAPSLRLLENPDVTVRSRGVMEKCTYCVQRINGARMQAEREERPMRDGDVTPACAQACPTRAIVFGDLNDPTSRVRRQKESPLNYALLSELNTRPRTTYQARLVNSDPDAPAAPTKKEP